MKRNKSKAESLSKEEIISKRSARRFVMFISLSFIISFFVFLIGYFLRDSAVDDSIVKTNIWIIIVVFVLPVVNALLRKFCFSRKLEDRLYKKRETICQQNVNCHFRRLRFIRIVSDAYAVVLAVISVLNNREIEYLDVLKQVERWKQDGEPLSDFEQTI